VHRKLGSGSEARPSAANEADLPYRRHNRRGPVKPIAPSLLTHYGEQQQWAQELYTDDELAEAIFHLLTGPPRSAPGDRPADLECSMRLDVLDCHGGGNGNPLIEVNAYPEIGDIYDYGDRVYVLTDPKKSGSGWLTDDLESFMPAPLDALFVNGH
jgi:hypothetical protein